MSYAILLGLIQGLTEFLPVSSTAHLVLVHEWTGFSTGDDPAFDIVLQLATAIAALIYFRKDVAAIVRSALGRSEETTYGRRLAAAIVVGTVPAVVAGFLFEDVIEGVFRNSAYIAAALVAGSALMYAAERAHARRREAKPVTAAGGAYIGLFQALALIPGISRSGATISGALFFGLAREEAVRFSFLLSIPVMFGATAKKLIGLDPATLQSFALPLAAGFAVSFAVGLASIHFLTTYLRTRTFSVFIWYRIALAAVLAASLLV